MNLLKVGGSIINMDQVHFIEAEQNELRITTSKGVMTYSYNESTKPIIDEIIEGAKNISSNQIYVID